MNRATQKTSHLQEKQAVCLRDIFCTPKNLDSPAFKNCWWVTACPSFELGFFKNNYVCIGDHRVKSETSTTTFVWIRTSKSSLSGLSGNKGMECFNLIKCFYQDITGETGCHLLERVFALRNYWGLPILHLHTSFSSPLDYRVGDCLAKKSPLYLPWSREWEHSFHNPN